MARGSCRHFWEISTWTNQEEMSNDTLCNGKRFLLEGEYWLSRKDFVGFWYKSRLLLVFIGGKGPFVVGIMLSNYLDVPTALPATNTVYFWRKWNKRNQWRCDLAEYCVHFLTKPLSRRQGQIRVVFVLQDGVFFLWWSQFSFNNVWFSCLKGCYGGDF